MTATPRRILPTVLKVTAVLSALAIATFLIVRAQRGREEAIDPSTHFDDPDLGPLIINPLEVDDRARTLKLPAGLNSSKSLVIEPSDDVADKPPRTTGFDDFALPSSKSGRLPAPTPPQPQPQQPKKQ